MPKTWYATARQEAATREHNRQVRAIIDDRRRLAELEAGLLEHDAYEQSPASEDQPEDLHEDEHFPWNYTEFGVECACGSAMDAKENCLGQACHG